VFNASTGINPQSGLLANASKTNIINNDLPGSSYSEAIDGARARQPFNDEYYGGVSSEKFGTVTFGRQRSLGTDVMLLYDPAGGSYAFSYIGYNGTMAGGGDTEDSRWDDAVKYRVNFGPGHLAAMYKFADGNGGCFSASATWTAANCTPETAHNNAFGGDLGGGYHKFSGDLVYQHYNQAISVLNPLLGAQSVTATYQNTTDSVNENPINGANLISTDDTVYGIVTDNNAFLATGKYAGEQFKVFGGFEYIWQNNPHNPLGVGASDQGGYFMSGVEDNNLDSEKILRIWWTGVKYAYDKKNRYHVCLVRAVAEQLPCSADLLGRSRLPQFLRGPTRPRLALYGSSLHQAFRWFCRTCVFLRDRRHGHRHSSWPGRPLSPQQQLCSDDRWSFHLPIVSLSSPTWLWFIVFLKLV
jgi:hypothetical protein